MPIEIRQRTESELDTFRITSEIAFGESVRLDPRVDQGMAFPS